MYIMRWYNIILHCNVLLWHYIALFCLNLTLNCTILFYYDIILLYIALLWHAWLLRTRTKLYQMRQFLTNVISSQMTFQSIKFFNKDIICFTAFQPAETNWQQILRLKLSRGNITLMVGLLERHRTRPFIYHHWL